MKEEQSILNINTKDFHIEVMPLVDMFYNVKIIFKSIPDLTKLKEALEKLDKIPITSILPVKAVTHSINVDLNYKYKLYCSLPIKLSDEANGILKNFFSKKELVLTLENSVADVLNIFTSEQLYKIKVINPTKEFISSLYSYQIYKLHILYNSTNNDIDLSNISSCSTLYKLTIHTANVHENCIWSIYNASNLEHLKFENCIIIPRILDCIFKNTLKVLDFNNCSDSLDNMQKKKEKIPKEYRTVEFYSSTLGEKIKDLFPPTQNININPKLEILYKSTIPFLKLIKLYLNLPPLSK